MEKKLYFLSALVLAGIILGFVPGENEKIKVSVVHYENGQVTVQDTVFNSSSGYSVEAFLNDNGYDSETTEIINTDNFEGKYLTEFKTQNTFEFKDIDKSNEGQNFQFAFEFDDENGKYESLTVTKTIDENGNVVTEKKVNGEVVEMTDEELAELEEKLQSKTENIFINCDSAISTVKVMKWNNGGETEFQIKVDELEMEEGDGLHEFVIVEEVEEGDQEVIIEKIVTKKLSEIDPNEMENIWIHDSSNGKTQIKTIKSEDGKDIDVEVIINDEKVNLEELSDDIVIESTAPKAYIIKSTSESKAPNSTEDVQIKVVTIDAPEINATDMDEIKMMKFEIATEFDSEEPMFMRSVEEVEPHTIAIVSRIAQTDQEEDSEDEDVEINDFQITQDQVNLPIEDLQFFPNPTDGDFRMSFFLPQRGETSIYIYDANGKEVLARNLGNFQGAFSDDFDLSRFESGTYILNIVQNNLRLAEKIIVN